MTRSRFDVTGDGIPAIWRFSNVLDLSRPRYWRQSCANAKRQFVRAKLCRRLFGPLIIACSPSKDECSNMLAATHDVYYLYCFCSSVWLAIFCYRFQVVCSMSLGVVFGHTRYAMFATHPILRIFSVCDSRSCIPYFEKCLAFEKYLRTPCFYLGSNNGTNSDSKLLDQYHYFMSFPNQTQLRFIYHLFGWALYFLVKIVCMYPHKNSLSSFNAF